MRRRALLCTIGTTVLAGCGGRLDGPTETETPDPSPATTEADAATERTTSRTDAERALRLADEELARRNEGTSGELATVVGSVVNAADETFAEVTATATFADADGGVLDRATADVADLSPGRSWSFELVYPGTGEDAREVADYALAVEITD